MIKVNLLSSQFIKKEVRHEIMFIAYSVLCIVILIGASKYGLNYRSYSKVESRNEQLKQELKKYQSIVQQVDTLKKTKSVLETQKKVISSLMAVRLIYPFLMEDLLKILPDNIWIKTMKTAIKDNTSMSIKVNAESLDNISIADFIKALTDNPGFSDVELGPITTSKSAKTETSVFTLTFNHLIGKK